MTASGAKARVRPQRRIIERPRLIKLLDETDARTILLVAPAGYGKTTLARQWSKTLNGAIWVTLTPAHRDVAWIAEAIAREIAAGAKSGANEIREHVRAHVNPQRAAHELARVVADIANQRRLQWIVLDDYHEIAASPEAEAFVQTLWHRTTARVLIVSRRRPRWIGERAML